jgi:hypothetical protein
MSLKNRQLIHTTEQSFESLSRFPSRLRGFAASRLRGFA